MGITLPITGARNKEKSRSALKRRQEIDSHFQHHIDFPDHFVTTVIICFLHSTFNDKITHNYSSLRFTHTTSFPSVLPSRGYRVRATFLKNDKVLIYSATCWLTSKYGYVTGECVAEIPGWFIAVYIPVVCGFTYPTPISSVTKDGKYCLPTDYAVNLLHQMLP